MKNSVRFAEMEVVLQFDPHLAEIRFGCGLSPKVSAPASVEAMLSSLAGPDQAALAFPISETKDVLELNVEFRRIKRKISQAKKQGNFEPEDKEVLNNVTRKLRRLRETWLNQALMRGVWTEDGFRERLSHFWFDHFSVRGKDPAFANLTATYVETAIRPNIAGKFGDMLLDVVLHPHMIRFLDQQNSIGPESDFAQKRRAQGKPVGLNENLAREILELHTLGVGGPYSQKDVRQLAELLTGLTSPQNVLFGYKADRAEPGSKVVLGKSYGGPQVQLQDIRNVLNDLAVHPVTARHLARKLAVHFVSDRPPDALVEAISVRYLETGGDLVESYSAMLNHPLAWSRKKANFKRPLAFIMSAMRALAVPETVTGGWKPMHFERNLAHPMALMGQNWLAPLGPDGWAEDDEHWLSPQGLGARLQWSMATPPKLVDALPDPRSFVVDALGANAAEDVIFAAQAAETRNVGVAMVLMSPAFQRHGV
ncbi:DUF1800 domain-containing protein [Shimia sp.]|uniref:DUF1800 domain-containing protein n=1 Tax=Shimia sp. TaxID=1954381 RepID=UPI00329689B1